MSPIKIEAQTNILHELCQIMYMSAEIGSSSITCRFEYSRSSDNSISVGAEFSYCLGGEEKPAALAYPERKKLSDLVPDLHSKMKADTGGNWTAFTLTIGEDGKARTKFEYPEGQAPS